jgi:LL-diaminopimelate aminotransferase
LKRGLNQNELFFSKRTDNLASAIFAQLETRKNQLLSQGREVFDFGAGTPVLPPALHLIEVLQDEVTRPENYRYAIKDLPELIDAVILWYQRRFAVTLDPDQVLALMGSQEGLSHIALTLVNHGETVLVPDPGYPIFNAGPLMADATLYKMPLLPEKDFIIDLDAIEPAVAHQAKLMIVSYPNNPTTAMAPVEFYEKLVWFAKKYDIVVVHDNAYCELVFDGK